MVNFATVSFKTKNIKSSSCFMFQLHGTGLHYKTHVGGRQGVLQKFPHIEEQIQVEVSKGSFLHKITS